MYWLVSDVLYPVWMCWTSCYEMLAFTQCDSTYTTLLLNLPHPRFQKEWKMFQLILPSHTAKKRKKEFALNNHFFKANYTTLFGKLNEIQQCTSCIKYCVFIIMQMCQWCNSLFRVKHNFITNVVINLCWEQWLNTYPLELG